MEFFTAFADKRLGSFSESNPKSPSEQKSWTAMMFHSRGNQVNILLFILCFAKIGLRFAEIFGSIFFFSKIKIFGHCESEAIVVYLLILWPKYVTYVRKKTHDSSNRPCLAEIKGLELKSTFLSSK